MALRLEIVSAHRQRLGERGVKEFGRDGGTIGRSLESDWVLPDTLRYVSSRHASIDFRSGSYYIVDSSTNGVYVNDSEEPVGRGNPQRLFDGDRLKLGEYEMRVSIDEHDDDGVIFDGGHVDPVDLAQRVQAPEPTYYDLVDPHVITGAGIEEILADGDEDPSTSHTAQVAVLELTLADEYSPPVHASRFSDRDRRDSDATSSSKAFSSQSSMQPAPGRTASVPPTSAASARAVSKGADAAGSTAAAQPATGAQSTAGAHGGSMKRSRPDAAPKAGASGLAAFCRGAGLPVDALDEQNVEQILHRAGQLIRELILVVTESLQIRAEQKGMLRLPNTTIQRQANNPLKLAASIDEALDNLFFRPSPDYLTAVEAVREALRDIKTHQQLMVGALPTAVADYVGRLDPDELEQKFSGGRRGTLTGAAHKLRYWDLYKDLYQVVANHAPGQLPPQFVEELSRVYEQEATRIASLRANTKQAG
jgi:type VI secretion system protein